MTQKEKREFEALRWFSARIGAEVVRLHANPTQKLSDLRSEVDGLVERALSIKGRNAKSFAMVLTDVSTLLDDVERHMVGLSGS